MTEYEADNAAVRESLAQRNPVSTAAIVTRAAGVTISDAGAGTTVDPPAETVVPNSGNRQVVPTDPARLAAAYPWGMPPHLTTSLTTGEAFFPHSKILTFSEEKPNVKTNRLPNHDGPSISVIIKEEPAELVKWVDEVKTPFSVVLRKHEEFGFLEGVHSDCSVCESDPDGCEQLRECVQELMNQGLVQFSKSKAAEEVAVIEPIIIVYRKKKVEAPPKRIHSIHFRVPTPFPCQNTKAIPWNYETTTYLGGKEIRISDTEIVNIAGAGSMTRSGRAKTNVLATPTVTTAPVVTRVIDNDKAVEAEVSKGKGMLVEKEQSDDYKKSITIEESQEFLKLFRKSDFKIVEQLNQTPSKISIFSLLLSSEAHRKALLKVLNATHVMQDITVDQFDDVVANITASRYLGFNEAELPPEGKAHNKALHISVTCTDSLLSRVLVDTGSSLNVLPKSTLSQLQFKGPEMRTSALIVRAFDGSRRQVVGEVDLSICVGQHQFSITFQVMDINPTYSCLLGRPWIHAAGKVTSTLHQKLKYLIDDKLVIVCGE
ncbi:uncharacterized protein LOC127123560 [Lathyrus oleraceus]|uniref:uncharacterized protein LOC127123560 n=1 Tax=Pisum sativum TaxID=3888 RepID=UPI0021CEE771|nr:uncharacterized protein LOC127123560 [Pisum sativum]